MSMSNTAASEAPGANEAKTIGHHVDAFLTNARRSPLVAVGLGIVAGYLLARLLAR
jgi:hypothetical protein